ncbi:MAG: hypothetical protein AB7E85_04490 [Pseudobdellovibrionaceae bacterium]
MSIVAISGSWRTVNGQVARDVTSDVLYSLDHGDKIVTGGALGVDYIATDTALRYRGDITGRLQVILPTSYATYRDHFLSRARQGVISHKQALELMVQLETVKALGEGALIEMDGLACMPSTYYKRNAAVVDAADELFAYHVNGSQGVQDAIDRATAAGKPVRLHSYKIAALG